MTEAEKEVRKLFSTQFADNVKNVKFFVLAAPGAVTADDLFKEIKAIEDARSSGLVERLDEIDGDIPQVRFDAPF